VTIKADVGEDLKDPVGEIQRGARTRTRQGMMCNESSSSVVGIDVEWMDGRTSKWRLSRKC
jgi:hypothetical protein